MIIIIFYADASGFELQLYVENLWKAVFVRPIIGKSLVKFIA